MIKTHIIKEEDKPIAVIMDYEEYRKLKEIEEDYQDYHDAVETKKRANRWIDHSDVKKHLNME